MLEVIREKLNELTSVNMDRLTEPTVVAISQELDPYITEAQRKLNEGKM